MSLEEENEQILDVFRRAEHRDPGDVETLLVQVIERLSANHYLRKEVFLNKVREQVEQMLEKSRSP